jgi:hypothetical protein
VDDIPTPDPGKYVIAYVVLFEGQTELLDEHIRVTMSLGQIGHAHTLDSLTDVSASSPSESDLLVYRTDEWVNEAPVDIASDDANIEGVNLTEQVSDPSPPATGHWLVYAKSDGLYVIDDTGTAQGPFGAGAVLSVNGDTGTVVVDYASVSAQDGDTDVTGAELEELTDGSETTLHSHAGGELLMQDGVTAPPVPIENEAQDDWLYQG